VHGWKRQISRKKRKQVFDDQNVPTNKLVQYERNASFLTAKFDKMQQTQHSHPNNIPSLEYSLPKKYNTMDANEKNMLLMVVTMGGGRNLPFFEKTKWSDHSRQRRHSAANTGKKFRLF
jgi:hypothetical protein